MYFVDVLGGLTSCQRHGTRRMFFAPFNEPPNTCFSGIKRSKTFAVKQRPRDMTSACHRVPSGTVLRLAVVKLDVATLEFLRI
jgi:hypothetical protein